MARLILVLSLCSCGFSAVNSLPGSWNLRPSPFGPIGVPHSLGFLEAQPKAPKSSPVASDAIKNSAVKSQSNHTSHADDIMHPKVEYDADTAALMAQADSAIQEAEAVDKAPPPPPKKSDKQNKDEQQSLGMINALRGMVCGHKLKKHLSLCDLKEFQGAEIKSEVKTTAIPEATEDSPAPSESDSVSDRADDLMAKIDNLQNSVGAAMPQDAHQALLDVVHSASSISMTHHTTGAEAAALMKSDVTANLPASVRDTILSVMKDSKPAAEVHEAAPTDVTANLPASVRDTVLAVMKDAKH